MRFDDRHSAGIQLGQKLAREFTLADGALALGLVRGGAVVSAAVASVLGIPWDIFIVKKLGAPNQPEYALGAYAETGAQVLNKREILAMGLTYDWITQAVGNARKACAQMRHSMGGNVVHPEISGREVVLVDDGIATGFTMLAAAQAAIQSGASRVIIAAPVAAPGTEKRIAGLGLECCFISSPPGFRAVGQYYRDFAPVTTTDVRELLVQRGS